MVRAGRPDLITKIILSRPGANRVAACRNVRASANARSILSAAVSMTVVRDQVRDPIIALGGVSGHVMRLASVEKELNGKPLPGADEIQALVSAAVRPAATLAGSAAFRKYQAGVVVALALREALRQKGGRG